MWDEGDDLEALVRHSAAARGPQERILPGQRPHVSFVLRVPVFVLVFVLVLVLVLVLVFRRFTASCLLFLKLEPVSAAGCGQCRRLSHLSLLS